jgi:hypothetical protein
MWLRLLGVIDDDPYNYAQLVQFGGGSAVVGLLVGVFVIWVFEKPIRKNFGDWAAPAILFACTIAGACVGGAATFVYPTASHSP